MSIAAEFARSGSCSISDVDFFQRTTSPNHAKVVQDLFDRCRANGYIYKGSYSGQYCIFDNLYVNDAKPGDPCPDCGRPTETITEENFFFKLSAFQDKLLELYERIPIHPARDAPQRGHLVRQDRPHRSLHHPHEHQMGHPRGGRSAARLLRLVRRADHVHERGRGQGPLARRPAPDRQGDRPLPRRLLARVPDGRRATSCPSASSPTAGCSSRTTR